MSRALLPTATPARTWAAVRALLRPRRAQAIAASAVLVLGTAVGLLVAPLIGRIVDVVVRGGQSSEITMPAILLACAALVLGVSTALGMGMVARLGESMLADLRERFVDSALALPLADIEAAGSGDLTARVTRDVTVVADAVRVALPTLARSSVTIVLILVGMAVLDWRFLLAALLAAPVQVHTLRWYTANASKVYAAQRVAVGVQQQQLLDSIEGAATVRAFGLAEEHVTKVRRRSAEAVDLAMAGTRLLTRLFGRLNIAEYIGLCSVLATGFLLVGNGSATIGTATAAALYFHSVFNPINAALSLADDAQSAAASLARLVGVADGTVIPATERAPLDPTVKLADVGHEYTSGRPVLTGVHLEITPGELVAFVGASGAGKTTLAKLIAGVHVPTTGAIAIGGVDLVELDQATLRRTVALITQEVHVFAGPLCSDLRLARPAASDADLRAALALVSALDWAEALPDGVDTVVGAGGHRLTVTQAQQVALARLVLADPPIAILDEATADAGSAGARVLEASAAAALAGRTALVVAHRLTQAANADRVVVLDAGRVVETGTHTELVAAGGRYATLWRAWSAAR